jgi:hypothetical protein
VIVPAVVAALAARVIVGDGGNCCPGVGLVIETVILVTGAATTF